MNLIDAVRTEPLENIKSIVGSRGIPIDSLYLDYTVLNTSLECRRKDVAEFLLKKQHCRVNKFTLTQEAASTPLHHAIILGDQDLVTELLRRKASILAIDVQGNTPLHLAFIRREEQMVDAIINVIQETGTYTNLKNSKALSHMHIICTRRDPQVISGFVKIVKNIEQSVREDSQSWAGYTALHFAVKFKSSVAVKILLEAGASRQAKDIRGQTPLQLANEDLVESSIIVDSLSTEKSHCCDTMSQFHLACLKNDPSVLESFIEKGVDANVPVHYSSSFCPDYAPLHFAVQGNCEENVKLLLTHSVDEGGLNEYYQTPLHLSLYKDNPKITKMLYNDVKSLGNMTDCNGLNYLDVAVAMNDVAQINSYLDEGEDANKRVTYEKQKFYRYTPLHIAVAYGNLEATQLLLDRGASIDASDGARHGTPLHLALKLGHQELVEFLLARNADARALRPCDQATTIHVLVESYVRRRANDESLKYVERLTKLGVDVNAKTNSNSTALHIACLYNDAKCARLLLEFGADLDVESKSGNTPFGHCVPSGDDEQLCIDAGDLVEVLYHHVQKLKALGMRVDAKNESCCENLMRRRDDWYPGRFRDEVLRQMEKQREDEVAKLEATALTPHTTMKDFLMLDAKHAAPYLRILRKIIEKTDELMKEFPGYGYLIKLRYRQADQRRTKRMNEEARSRDVGCQTAELEVEEVPVKRLCPKRDDQK